jgi:hypothetical protein
VSVPRLLRGNDGAFCSTNGTLAYGRSPKSTRCVPLCTRLEAAGTHLEVLSALLEALGTDLLVPRNAPPLLRISPVDLIGSDR